MLDLTLACGDWNLHVLQPYLLEEDVSEALKVPWTLMGSKDKVLKLPGGCEYSARSGY